MVRQDNAGNQAERYGDDGLIAVSTSSSSGCGELLGDVGDGHPWFRGQLGAGDNGATDVRK
jgi:hypothetical protein